VARPRYSPPGAKRSSISPYHGHLARVSEQSDPHTFPSKKTRIPAANSALSTPIHARQTLPNSATSRAPAQNKHKNLPPRPRHRGSSAKQSHARFPRYLDVSKCPTMPHFTKICSLPITPNHPQDHSILSRPNADNYRYPVGCALFPNSVASPAQPTLDTRKGT
jgi:hypothetical protein